MRNAVQHCAIHQKRQLCVRFEVIYCLAVRITVVGIYLDAPHPVYLLGGLAKTRLLSIDAQIDAQNAPFDLQPVTPKL